MLRRVKLLERFLDPPPSVLAGSEAEPAAEPFLAREISDAAAAAHLAQLAAEYEKLRNDLPTGEAARLKASLLTLAACRDYEKTPDDEPHGVFTQALLDALVGAPASYEALRDGIAEKLNGRPQTPVLSAPPPGPDFRSQRPFTI